MHQTQNIQPHGCLLALSKPGFRIEQASENTGRFLGAAPQELLGRKLNDFLPEAGKRIRNSSICEQGPSHACYLGEIAAPGRAGALAMHLHRADRLLVVEFEPARIGSGKHAVDAPLRTVVASLSATRSCDDVCRLAVRELKNLTGYGRVLACMFEDEGEGRVIAELADKGYERFLGRSYPAVELSDGALAYYGHGRSAVVCDASASPSALRSAKATPLDLGGATLRCMPPELTEWMSSSGYRSAIVLVLTMQEKPWGLIVCQHCTVRGLPATRRDECDLIGRMASLQIESMERQSALQLGLHREGMLAGDVSDLQTSNRELEVFSYSAAHELSAPLRRILDYTTLLQECDGPVLSSLGSHFLDNIRGSAQYASQLIDNLLGFSQVGRAALRCAEVNLQALVELIRTEITDGHPERKIQWIIRPLPVVFADPALMRLALRNLLSNAVKYTRGRDPAIIEIGVQPDSAETIIFVRDNGVGFDMQYSGKLFGVFQRLHRAQEFEGTGIGLASVKRIIEHHKGRVWAQGSPNEGATFSFSLPLRQASAW